MTDLEEVYDGTPEPETPEPLPSIEELRNTIAQWQNYSLTLQQILQILVLRVSNKAEKLGQLDELQKSIILFSPAMGLAETLDTLGIKQGDEDE